MSLASPSVDPKETPPPQPHDFPAGWRSKEKDEDKAQRDPLEICKPGSDEDFAAWHENKAFLLSSTMKALWRKPPQGDCLDKGKKEQV